MRSLRAVLLKILYPLQKQLVFQCNICGNPCRFPLKKLSREVPSCICCGSTVRERAIIHILSTELFGRSLPLPDFPIDLQIKGLGMSDRDVYAVPLAQKLGYVNTHYHKSPRLDITNIDNGQVGQYDFLISTDVFEHVTPPVSRAFNNARKLLKPSGVFIFSVPYTTGGGETREHFPDLNDFKIVKRSNRYELENTTTSGEVQRFTNLTFHGGKGSTLEIRLFSLESLHREFQVAGFNEIKIYEQPCLQYGIFWGDECWSLPMSTRVVV